MVEFKVILSDPQSGKSYKIDATGSAAGAFMGKAIGEVIEGAPLGLGGYKVQITGGSDRTGTPARKDLPGPVRRRILLSRGVGFRPVQRGQRMRKSLRGNEITSEFVQVNAKVVDYGSKTLEEVFNPPSEEPEKDQQ